MKQIITRMSDRYIWLLLLVVVSMVLATCGGPTSTETTPSTATQFPTPSIAPVMAPLASPVATVASDVPSNTLDQPGEATTVRVDARQNLHAISPLIYGLNQPPDEVVQVLHPTLNRWGGNPSTRYNWKLGNAWNAARDYFYRNGDYGYTGQSASDDFVSATLAAHADAIMTLPTLGWVAKNHDLNTCSFPTADGQCSDADQAACDHPGEIAAPERTSVPSDVTSIVDWVKHLTVEKQFKVRFFAFDNEPDIWGSTHYDVHPKCTTYDEIRDKYVEYASAVRAAAPHAELLGPVSCCWYFYWNSAAGAADKAAHGGQDFLPWFLDAVRAHDQQAGVRTLDVMDIHYYPEGVYNDTIDDDIAAHRLRSTRSLWDASYIDESWINQPVNLIPRMQQLIAEHYPDTKLGISEWNWGADKTLNGALAIADVLGIYGRENVYLASYWRYPELNSPGFYAFKLYMNYDDQGARFGDTSIQTTSSNPNQVSAYAARDSSTKRVTLMLINKDPHQDITTTLDLQHIMSTSQIQLYRYSAANPNAIVKSLVSLDAYSTLTLPAYSISLLVFEAQ